MLWQALPSEGEWKPHTQFPLMRLRTFPSARSRWRAIGGVDKAGILAERAVAILNGQFVFMLPDKDLGPRKKRWPQRGIAAKSCVDVSLRILNVTPFQLFFRILPEFHRNPVPTDTCLYNDWYGSLHGCRAN
jgi:hypothetical protein